jgi:hypothetical protein
MTAQTPQLTRSILTSALSLTMAGLSLSSLQAQTPDNATMTALHERVTTFLGALGDRTTARRAVEQIVEAGPLEQQTNTTKLIEQVEQFSSRYGLYLESERVAARAVGRDLVILTYLYKTDQFPVIWRFTFYRPPSPTSSTSAWRVVAISFDTNYQLLELSVGEDSLRLEP